MFLKEPTISSAAARTMKIRLKKVNTFSLMICFSLRVLEAGVRFMSPFFDRTATSCIVSPALMSAEMTGTGRNAGCVC